jgi:hypothetical protein
VAEKLKQVDNVVSTVDICSSVAMDSYKSITCHYIDEEWLVRSIILETMELQVSHTAKNISDILEDI